MASTQPGDDFEIRWGDQGTVTFQFGAAGGSVELRTDDLVYVPDRGLPRVYLASFICTTDFSPFGEGITVDHAVIDFYLGSGQVIQQFAQPVNLGSPEFPAQRSTAELPARMIRAQGRVKLTYAGGTSPKTCKVTINLIVGPVVPFTETERRRVGW